MAESVANRQWFNQLWLCSGSMCICMESLRKQPEGQGSENLLVGEHSEIWGVWYARRRQGSSTYFLYTFFCWSFLPGCSWVMCMCRCSVTSHSLQPPGDCSPPGSSVHGIFQARVLVGSRVLLQGIFLTQGWNLHLLHLLCWQVDSLPQHRLGRSWVISFYKNLVI